MTGPRRGRRLRSYENDPRPIPVADALAELGAELGWPPPGVVTPLISHWPEIVGEAVAEHARMLRLRNGVLTIAVDAAPWATELRYLGGELETRIATIVGPGVVLELRIVVAPPETDRP